MATNGKYVSFEEIMYRIKRNPIMEDASKADIALDTYDLLKKIGAPGAYSDERVPIRIDNYIGELPKDLLYIKEMVYVKETGTNVWSELPMQYVIGNKTSKWHCSNSNDLKIRSSYGYSIMNNKVHTDLETGELAIYYKAIKMDDEGYPLIPDNPYVVSAIVAYVKLKHMEIKAELGYISGTALPRIEQEYYFNMRAAETAYKMPSTDEYNSIAKSLLRIIRDLDYKE